MGILFTTVALDLIGFGMVVPLMPLYARNFGVGPQAIAILLACYSLMQFFFAPLWGRLSDRVGRRPVLLGSMAGNVVALICFATAQTFAQLLVSRIIAGVCTANIAVASAYVADVTPAHLRARGMGMIGAAFGLGFVLGPFFAGELSTLGVGAPPLVAAFLAAINLALAAWRLPESLPAQNRIQATQAGPSTPFAILRHRLQSARAEPQVAQLLVLIFAHVLGFAMMEMALTLMVSRRLGFGPMHSGRLLAFVGLVLVVVQGGLVGRLSRKLGDRRLFEAGLVLLAAGLVGVPLAALYGVAPLLAALALLAVGQGLVAPTGAALLSQRAGPASQGQTLGLAQSSSALARVFGPMVAGAAYANYGDLMPFFVGSATVLAAAAAALTWLGHEPPRPPQPSPGARAPQGI